MLNKMLFVGEKESFIARVLIKKVIDAGVDCQFVAGSVDAVSAAWGDATLVTLYIDEGTRPKEDLLHFLIDTLEEKGLKLILVGEQEDLNYVCDHIPRELIYQEFVRPVDNNKFIEAVTEYFAKVQTGEFKKRILIVDDDPQYLSLVREWLKNDYKVTMANSGLQAIKYLGKNKVDLILLDHEMPVTSGPQVLEMLRSDPETSGIPVMFLTGRSDKESVMAVLALKPEGYFLKTIQKAELLEKLGEFFILHQ